MINSVDPGGGPLGGGNRIVISGSGFEGNGLGALTGVDFAAATQTSTRPALKVGPADVTVVSDNEIVVTEAPDATTPTNHDSTFASSVSVVFKAADGTITHSVPATDGDDDYFFGAPVIDSLTPTVGPATGGNTILVHGSGFENPALQLTSVVFTTGAETGTVSLAAPIYTVVSDDEMKITAPDASDDLGTSGILDTYLYVKYKVKDEATVTVTSDPLEPGDNEYVYGVPLIEAVDPEGGPLDGGNSIALKGSGFDNADLSLKSIDFYAADSGKGPDSGTDSTTPLLQVTCVSTDTCDVASDTEIDVVAPTATDAGTSGDAVLSTEITAVFTANNSGDEVDSQPLAEGDNDYVFGAPVVDSVTPEGGSLDGGTTILIDGSGFEEPGLTLESVAFSPLDDTVESDTLLASDTDVTILSNTKIEVKTPDASGPAGTSPTLDTEVTVVYSDETERTVLSVPAVEGDNDYTFGAPVVTAIDPAGGPEEGGNTITVLGSGFDDPDLQLTSVSFEPEGDTGGLDEVSVDGSDIHVVSNTEIQVVAPDVTDQLTEGQDVLLAAVTAHFTADDDTAVESVPAAVGDNLYTFGAPTIDSVAPDDGPLGGGNTITITGSGFDEPGLTLTGVNFDPGGDSEGSAAFSADPDQIHVVSDTEIEVTAPDATAAADGAPHLQTTITVTFTDTEGSEIDSVPSTEGANEYTYNETATITQVLMYGGSSDPTIVVHGHGFGTEPGAVSPCVSGGEDFANDDLSFGDLTTLTGAGAVGDCIGLDVSTYTNTEIEFTLGAGYSNYPVVAAGDQFTVDVYGAIYTGTVSWNAQTIQFTSSPPSPAVVGGKGYTPQATSSAGLQVAITVDHTSSAVCGITDGVVSFFAPGTCTLDANQPGNLLYPAATQVQQSFTVDQPTTSVTVSGTGTVNAGATYSASASGNGNPAPTYALVAGAPSWLSINATTGAISGSVPTDITTFSYSVKATNSVGHATSSTQMVTVDQPTTTVTLSGTGTVSGGTTYSAVASGNGNPAPTYALVAGAPAWLSINATTGAIAGTVPTNITSFSYSVKATNTTGTATSSTQTVTVDSAPTQVTVSGLVNGRRRGHLQRLRLGQRQSRTDLRAGGRCPVLAVDRRHNRGHRGHRADQPRHLLLLGQGHQPGRTRHQLDPDGDGGPADDDGHGQRDRHGERRSHLQRFCLGQREPRAVLRARGRCPGLAVDQRRNRGHLGHRADQYHHLLLLGQGHQHHGHCHQLDPDGDGGPADDDGHGQRDGHGGRRCHLQRFCLGQRQSRTHLRAGGRCPVLAVDRRHNRGHLGLGADQPHHLLLLGQGHQHHGHCHQLDPDGDGGQRPHPGHSHGPVKGRCRCHLQRQRLGQRQPRLDLHPGQRPGVAAQHRGRRHLGHGALDRPHQLHLPGQGRQRRRVRLQPDPDGHRHSLDEADQAGLHLGGVDHGQRREDRHLRGRHHRLSCRHHHRDGRAAHRGALQCRHLGHSHPERCADSGDRRRVPAQAQGHQQRGVGHPDPSR